MTQTTLKRIRLELGRTDDFPAGSADHGYEFVAPLRDDGHLATEAWKDLKSKCTVTRFWNDQPEKNGHLRHVGRGWRFDYDSTLQSDDEPFFKLEQHPFIPDQYVSVTENDGVQRPFRVVLVTPAVG